MFSGSVNPDQFPDIEVHLPDGLMGPVDDGVPYGAGFTIYNQSKGRHPTKWVILQNERMRTGRPMVLAKFREESETPYPLTKENSDLIIYYDDGKGWVDEDGDQTYDVKGIAEITNSFLTHDVSEEDAPQFIEEGPDPTTEFEGFYVIVSDDAEQFTLYDVTIKGEHPDTGFQIGYYIAIYTDGTSRTIDWEPNGVGWIERHIGKSPHSVSIGALVEKHFGPKW